MSSSRENVLDAVVEHMQPMEPFLEQMGMRLQGSKWRAVVRDGTCVSSGWSNPLLEAFELHSVACSASALILFSQGNVLFLAAFYDMQWQLRDAMLDRPPVLICTFWR